MAVSAALNNESGFRMGNNFENLLRFNKRKKLYYL